MTPGEWERCTNPEKMLETLRARGRADERPLRLFACACFRRLVPVLTNPTRFRRARTTPALVRRALKAVTVGERYADGAAREAELAAARRSLENDVGAVAWTAYEAVRERTDAVEAARDAVFAVTWALGEKSAGARAARREWRRWQAALIRDLFGDPFRPRPRVPPRVRTWDGGSALRLARVIDEGGRFEDLPVLADLLEEAGLTDAGLLAHLRGPGPHARGCHALAAVLARATSTGADGRG